ncbi:hypothetical protein MHYP_G00225900 [Metynnis hypsauchen]
MLGCNKFTSKTRPPCQFEHSRGPAHYVKPRPLLKAPPFGLPTATFCRWKKNSCREPTARNSGTVGSAERRTAEQPKRGFSAPPFRCWSVFPGKCASGTVTSPKAEGGIWEKRAERDSAAASGDQHGADPPRAVHGGNASLLNLWKRRSFPENRKH